MKTFWQTIMRVFHKYLFGSVIAYLIIIFPLSLLFRFVEAPEKIKEPATVYSCIILFCYGLSRVWRFHPEFNKSYLTQLALSPWELGKALPRGRVHLFWADAVVVAFFILLTFLFPVYDRVTLLMSFFVGYNMGLLLSFCSSGQERFITLYVLLTPLTVFPHLNPYLALLVLIGLTAIGTYGLHYYLKEFPWNTSWWKFNQVEELKKKAAQERIIQWPFLELNATRISSGGIGMGIAVAALFSWWFHVVDWLFIQLEKEEAFSGVLVVVIFSTIGGRLLIYVTKYHPPISALGRIFTGRLIIPGYDKVFLAPIITTVVAGLAIVSGWKFDMSVSLTMKCAAALAIFLSISLPPSLEKWHYTGNHRIAKPLKGPIRTLKRKTQTPEFFTRFQKS